MLQEVQQRAHGENVTKAYSELVYHFVWGTKERHPLINPDIEALLVPFLESKCRELGYRLHAVGCVEDHVHLVLSLSPTVTVAEVAKSLKGSSSHFVNSQQGLAGVLYWQRGYGVLTLGKKDIPAVAEYVRRQKEHHSRGGSVITELERFVASL